MSYFPGPVSPDGRTLVVVSESDTTPHAGPAGQAAPARRLRPAQPASSERPARRSPTTGTAGPKPAAWLPDGSALLATADDDGASPVFRISVPRVLRPEVGVTRVTQDAAAYTDVVVSPDGRSAYALRSSYEFPPEAGPDRPRRPGRPPGCRPRRSARTTRAGWSASRPLRPTGRGSPPTWRCRRAPPRRIPAPLLLWIHGGPLGSWNAWTWRWNPWLLTAKGYAVLLPDPALSTGYGQAYIQRGWGAGARRRSPT